MTHVAVIDIGKTNAKLALVDRDTLAERAVVTRPNRVIPGPPYPHFDLGGHWAFLLQHLAAFHAAWGVDAISVTTHGAAAVLLAADGSLACPMLDYEHTGPDDLAAAYDALRPPFAETGSARLPMGLNLGAQLHWLLETQPGLRERLAHVVTYPQYWGYRLTGHLATDVTSLGCHTDLWNPWEGRFSALPERLGLVGRIAPAARADRVLGGLRADLAAKTGLPAGLPVSTGIHDSNASLYPHLLGRTGPFSVVSTGTWVVCMAIGGARGPLDPARDVLVNVNALGAPVPSARFMGGREFDLIGAGSTAAPNAADRAAVLAGICLLPAVEPASGPFAGRQMRWTADPATPGQRMAALGYYLALMTDTCLSLIGAAGAVIVEGPFARNAEYLSMLAAIRQDGVQVAVSATGTSSGAALLCAGPGGRAETRPVAPPADAAALAGYAARWRRLL